VAGRSDSPLTTSSQLTWTWPGPFTWLSPRGADDLQLCPYRACPLLPSLPELPHSMPHTRVMAGRLPQPWLLDPLYDAAVVAG
jgi:hypothetical protein